MNRVVITGMGVISALGNDVETFWNNIINGKNGIDLITSFDTEQFDSKYAAEVKDIDYSEIPKRDLLFDSKFINLARVASIQAYKDSKLDIIDFDKDHFGVYISNSMGGVEKVNEGFEILKDKGPSKISPMLVPAMLPNMASGKVAIDLGAKGCNMSAVAACSGGANAIGEAYLKIKYGYEKVMVAGASDASITPFSIACFSAMKVLYRGDNKDEASIPFDKRRKGFVIGEGSAILILEELEHAKARNAKIYAEVVGYGCNCDAYNMVSPDYEGLTCTRAMNRALEEANIKENDISYVNAHGTSTLLNDKTETKAINEVFKSKPYVSSTKSMTGHLLSASGAIEALITVKAIETGIMPAMINYKKVDPECDLNFVVNKSKANPTMKYAMSNSFGFGGHNVCLIFKKWGQN